MYKIFAGDEKSAYEVKELAKMFVPAGEIEMIIEPCELTKNQQKRNCFLQLAKATGKTQDWGILTGVRPEKLYRRLVAEHGRQKAQDILKTEYLLKDEKIKLLDDTYRVQIQTEYSKDIKACGVYLGIPFCPSRCLYCSFTSNIISKPKASAYMLALEKEIIATAAIMEKHGLYAESVYIGGGTPTALDDEDFETLLRLTKRYFINDKTLEWTVECGRPDTITRTKLELTRKYGADRISINPQTMKNKTLELIGRKHKAEDIISAYTLAREFDFKINMDLICGLQEEGPGDFEGTLKAILDLNPENITVHTLAVKRASRLIDEDPDYAFRQSDTVREMLNTASLLLKDKYRPYYLYRQKHMAGNFENVGYERDNTPSIYNIRIMEEDQSIIALGAGAISKIYFRPEDRIERVANVSNYEIYIERIDEMIKRKENGIIL